MISCPTAMPSSPSSSWATARSFAVEDLDVGQVQQVLAMATAWEDAPPADNGSDAVVRALRAALGLS
jgi:hypothetical protein